MTQVGAVQAKAPFSPGALAVALLQGVAGAGGSCRVDVRGEGHGEHHVNPSLCVQT